MRIAAIAAIACVAFVAVAAFGYQSSTADVLAAGDVTLCTDINFGGTCKVAGPGRYPNFAAVGLPNDSLSSLKVPEGTVVTMYKDEGFRGDSMTVTGDQRTMVPSGWNDIASSLVIENRNAQKKEEEAKILQSVVSKVVTAATPTKTGGCNTCCPPVPNPLLMPPASCSDVAVDLTTISNTLATLAQLIRSQHLANLCKVSGSIQTNVRSGKDTVTPTGDIATSADALKVIVDNLLKQSKARVDYDLSAQSAAALAEKLAAEKAKVDALKKQQEAAEKKLKEDMAALAKAAAEQKKKDDDAKKAAADKAAKDKKVADELAAFNKQEAARKAEKLRLQQEAADLKAKEAKLLKDKAEKEAQLAAAKAKLDADKAAKAKAEADAKAAAALKTARDAQVAADAAAYAAASPSGKSVIQTQIAADTKKASDAGKAVVTAQNAAADAKKALDDGKQIIGKLTLDIPRILPRLIGIREQFQNDLNQVQAASPYVNGIDAKFYKLSSPPNTMPAFQALTPAFSNNLKTEINFRNADDFGKYGFTTRFALTLNGFIDIPYEGQWLFFIESDDGSKLFIDGNLVIENDGLHGMVEKSSSVRLTKGKHVLRVEFSQWDWGGGLILRWWGTQTPKAVVPSSAFFVLAPTAPAPFTGLISRIIADVKKDEAVVKPPAPPSVTITTATQQAVDNAALLLARKAKELQAEQERLAKYAADAAAAKLAQDKAAAATAQAAAAKKIADQMAADEQKKKDKAIQDRIAADSKRIDELKKAEAAAAVKLAEQKAAQELADARAKQESLQSAAAAAQAAFYSEAADYAANFGIVVTGKSITNAVGTSWSQFEGPVFEKTPLECVRACNLNPSCVAFSTTVTTAMVPGVAVTYYKASLEQLPSDWASMAPVKDMIVSNINFPSGQVQGASGMTTNFAAEFRGVVEIARGGQWTFFCSSDDGSKLFIDGKLVINNDGLHGMVTKQSNSLTLDQGRHSIRVEYFNREGPGGVVVEWMGPGTARSVLPASALFTEKPVPRGLLGKFYATPTLQRALPRFPVGSDMPLLKQVTVDNLNFPSSSNFGNLGLSVRFIGVFAGFITVPSSGKWTISSESDDGSKVYIDDNLLINNDGLHGMTEKGASLDLLKGSHSIRVEFFNGDGPGGLVLRWAGPKVSKQIIPNKAFTTASTLGKSNCVLLSSYDEQSLTSAEGRGNSGGSTYILARARLYSECAASGAYKLSKLIASVAPGRSNDVNWKYAGVKLPQGSTISLYDRVNYGGLSTLQKTTACLSPPRSAKSYEMRSPDDEKARAALEAAQAKAAAEAAAAAAAKKAKDDADAKAAAAAKAVAAAKAKAAADAAALLAVKADRKRLAVKAKNDALAQAKTKLNGHAYQLGLAEKNLKLVLEDEAAAQRRVKELGEGAEKAKADLDAIRVRNKQAIAAYEEAKKLHAAALDAFNARTKELSDENGRPVETY